MRFLTFLIIISILIHSPVWSAPPRPRPIAGIGILSIQVKGSDQATTPTITLYREPGVGRITDSDLSDFTALATVIKGSSGVYHLAVTKKKGEWVKVIFDDSGREAWLSMDLALDFQTWNRYLKGGEVRLLNGLKKEFYQLKTLPSTASAGSGAASREKNLRVVEIDDSWMLVLVDLSSSGWLRWKDDDGRLLISVER